MKKTLSLFLFMATWTLQAQTIPNSSFENWLFQGSFYDPQDWLTYNGDLENFGMAPNVTRDSAGAHDGKYAIALKTVNIPGYGLFPGYTQTDFTISSKPSAINGWFSYSGSGDTGVLYVRLFRRTQTGDLHQIKESITIFTNNSGYPFSTAFYDKEYPSETPDSCYIYLFSGKKEGSKLVLDELNFGPLLSVPEQAALSDVLLYPNPASDHITVSAKGKIPEQVTIRDLAGKIVLHSHNNSNIDISLLQCGVYITEVLYEGKTAVRKLVKS